MSLFNKRNSSGIFIPSGNAFVEYKGPKGNGSMNAITEELGYKLSEVYWPYIFDPKKLISGVIFELFTRRILFVLTDPKVTYLTEKNIKKYLGDFSVRKEFNSLKVNDIFTEAVEEGTLSVEFLARVLKLNNVSYNGMFYSEKIKTYLYFTNGILSDFQYDDGLFPYSRHLQEVNKTVYNWISGPAYKYWPNNEFQAQKEINIQCEAWANIPEAFGNEFISLHRTENGGPNLHMIRVCHYNYPINLNDFKEINHGRYSFVEEGNNLNLLVYHCGKFLYTFDKETEMLLYSDLIKS